MQYIGELTTDTLIVRVYPDKKSSYTLWEDDGMTYDYEEGKFAKTRFESADSEKETEFTIFAAGGTYNGMYQSRTYELEITIPKKPARVLVNKKEISGWKYDSDKVMLTVNQNNVREKQTIKIVK